MTDARALRLQLIAAGYCPIPLYGKSPPQYGKNNSRKGLAGWSKIESVTPEMIELWARTWPDASNTGCLTRLMPTLDVDILDEAATQFIAQLIRDRYEDAGYLITRIGRSPKFATPFRVNPDETFKKIAVSLIAPDGSEGQKIEFLADGEQIVVGGVHPDIGQPYHWSNGGLEQVKLEDLPYIREAEARALVEDIVEILIRDFGYRRAPGRPGKRKADDENGQTRGADDWGYLYENIRVGRELHDSIVVLAAKLIASGSNAGAARNQLRALVDASEAPKDERWRARVREIDDAVDSAVAKYGKQAEPEQAKRAPPKAPPKRTTSTIEDTVDIFRKWLVLSSPTPIYAMLGAVAANLLPGDPVWLGLIAPPSSAKSELLNSISELPNVVDADTVSPAGLLSGTPKKQHDKGARGGLLRQIGSFGILTIKDFGSVLSMHAETRAETLAALRKIYDGSWTRHLGSAGGKTLTWQGKVAIIFASTEAFDAHHAVIASMGDRFLLSRLKPVTGKKQFACALRHTGASIHDMRKELAAAVGQLFASRRPEASSIDVQETEVIGKVIAKAVRLRGAVQRDYRSREIEAIYGAEGTARIGLALERLLAGLETLGMEREKALSVIEEVALDSVPPLRRQAYDLVCVWSSRHEALDTANIAVALGLPTTTTRRILEELAAHGLIIRRSLGKGKADTWDAAPWEAEEAAADAADARKV
jgi:hypothetical protein